MFGINRREIDLDNRDRRSSRGESSRSSSLRESSSGRRGSNAGSSREDVEGPREARHENFERETRRIYSGSNSRDPRVNHHRSPLNSNTRDESFNMNIPNSKCHLVKGGLQLKITFKTKPDEGELEWLPGFHSVSHDKYKEFVRIVLFTDVESLEASKALLFSENENVKSANILGIGSEKRQKEAKYNCWVILTFKHPYTYDSVMKLDPGIQEVDQLTDKCCQVRFQSPNKIGHLITKLRRQIGFCGLSTVESPHFVKTYRGAVASIQQDSIVLRDVPKDVPHRCITEKFPDMIDFKLYDKTFPASKYCHAILQFKSAERVDELLEKKSMTIAGKKVYLFPAYQEYFQDFPEIGEKENDEEFDPLALEIKAGLELNITYKTEPKDEEFRELPGVYSVSQWTANRMSRILLFKDIESLELARILLGRQENVESVKLMGLRSDFVKNCRYFTLIFRQPYDDEAVRKLENNIEEIISLSQKSCNVYFASPRSAYRAFCRLQYKVGPGQSSNLQKLEVSTVVKNLWKSIHNIHLDSVVLRDVPKDVAYRNVADYFPDVSTFRLFYKTFPASNYCHGVFTFNNPERVTEILAKTDMVLAGKKVYPFPAYHEFFTEFPELGQGRITAENPVILAHEQKETTHLSKKRKMETREMRNDFEWNILDENRD